MLTLVHLCLIIIFISGVVAGTILHILMRTLPASKDSHAEN